MLLPSRRELLVGVWGALTFGALLASYFVFRPVRDALILDGKPEDIPAVFTATFIAVSVISPLWSGLLARGGGRRKYVPRAFHAFAVCWIGFGLLVYTEAAPVAVGRVFYVWSAVFNMFVVSVFWSLLADLLGPDVAKRLYGFIAAGGTGGAIVGPLLTKQLVGYLGVHGILVLSAVLLELAALSLVMLRRAGERLETPPPADEAPPEPALPAAFRGLARLRTPYLLGIVGYVLCTATAATFLYLEQAGITKVLLATREARTAYFAEVDFWTNLFTLVAQTLLAAPLLARFGPGVVLCALPLAQAIGISALSESPSLTTLMCVVIATRTATHGLTRPSRELLFTVVSRDDKYRAKNAIDTIGYRLGDVSSAWLYKLLVSIGGGSAALVAVAMPLVAVWLALAVLLGIGFRRRRQSHATAHQEPACPSTADASSSDRSPPESPLPAARARIRRP